MGKPNAFVAAWAAALGPDDEPTVAVPEDALLPNPAAEYAEPAEWFY